MHMLIMYQQSLGANNLQDSHYVSQLVGCV